MDNYRERQCALAGAYVAVATLLQGDYIKDEDLDLCIEISNSHYKRITDKGIKDRVDKIMSEDLEHFFK